MQNPYFLPLFKGQSNTLVPEGLSAFLALVAEGEQAAAEAMLQEAPNLAVFAGNVTDGAGRYFQAITGLQLALWSLDWHMWEMLMRYLPLETAQAQAAQWQEGPWVATQGTDASRYFQNILETLRAYLDNYPRWTPEHCRVHWSTIVGGAQRCLPMHAIHEYCHPERSFEPCPDFEDARPLPRSREVLVKKERVDVLSASWDKGIWGVRFAIGRGAKEHCICYGGGVTIDKSNFERDYQAMRALWHTRVRQRDRFISQLLDESVREHKAKISS